MLGVISLKVRMHIAPVIRRATSAHPDEVFDIGLKQWLHHWKKALRGEEWSIERREGQRCIQTGYKELRI